MVVRVDVVLHDMLDVPTVELKNIGAEVKAKMLLTIGREESAKWDASCATLPVNSQPNKGMSTTAIQEPCLNCADSLRDDNAYDRKEHPRFHLVRTIILFE
eukprot:CAMPEP_0169410900 /NCGR_PEP_ID=MMETSP1017-20121227/60017_1 /TAXON_ID=342587 /ORGANISM="Karlodinium micrum, Strain CCMP2283" /LENGTH=100 /DNA_ID=CAMNT_0009518175 /DNA_START=432 /DNA_END=732 /DNA_ORIENTATION=-